MTNLHSTIKAKDVEAAAFERRKKHEEAISLNHQFRVDQSRVHGKMGQMGMAIRKMTVQSSRTTTVTPKSMLTLLKVLRRQEDIGDSCGRGEGLGTKTQAGWRRTICYPSSRATISR